MSIRTECMSELNIRYSKDINIAARTQSLNKKSEQLNSNYRMFKTKLLNLKNATKITSKDPLVEMKNFATKKDKLIKKMKMIEEDRTESSAAKRKYEK